MIIHALKMWENNLLGSDHIGLWYLFDELNMNSCKAVWSATINEFDFKISYIKGIDNRVENALSR